MVVYVASCVDKDMVVVRIVLFVAATAIFVVMYALLVMLMFVL